MGATFTIRLRDALPIMGDDDGLTMYPVFDEDYRESLNKKIREHFWNQEIGVESIELFRFNLRRKMNEIMPPYNQLYKSTQIKFDPLSTISVESVSNGTANDSRSSTGNTNTTGNNTAEGISASSDFPQTALDENDTGNYASSSNESKSSGTSAGNAAEQRNESGASTNDNTSRSSGYTGPASDLLMRYRATIVNIDMMVIADLQELFMSVWDNGDTFTESGYIA